MRCIYSTDPPGQVLRSAAMERRRYKTERVIAVCADVCGVDLDKIGFHKSGEPLSRAQKLCIYFLYWFSHMDVPATHVAFPQFSRTSIGNTQRNIPDRFDQDHEFAESALRILRRLEQEHS